MSNSSIWRALSAILAIGLAPAAASAQSGDIYISGALGYSIGSEVGIDVELDDAFDTVFLFEPTEAVAGRIGIGYAFSDVVRAEIEASFRTLEIEDMFSINTGGESDSTGEADIATFMLSGYYDFEIPSVDVLTLYVGAGVGAAVIDHDFQRGPDNPGFVLSQASFTTLAGQLRIGAAYELSDSVSLFADYTYIYIGESEHEGFNTVVGDATQRFDATHVNEIALGVRFRF